MAGWAELGPSRSPAGRGPIECLRGIGLGLVEASRRGRPVVTSRCPQMDFETPGRPDGGNSITKSKRGKRGA